jgi:hypothetical protein
MNEIGINRVRFLTYTKEFIKHCDKQHEVKSVKLILEAIKNNLDHFASLAIKDGSVVVTFASSPEQKYSNRTETSIGRYIRRHIRISCDTFDDTSLNIFTTFIGIRLIKNYADRYIEVLRGDDIGKFYTEAKEISSCMSGKPNSVFKLYTLNPEKIALVTTKNKKARGLLITADNGLTFLHKTYYAKGGEVYRSMIYAWSEKHNIINAFRRYTTYGECFTGKSDFTKLILTLKTDGTMKKPVHFPYFDSFRFGNLSEKDNTITLSPSMSNINGHNITLNYH